MQIVEIDKSHARILLTAAELGAIIRVVRFVLDDLEFEYSTRTGFYVHETTELIDRLEKFEKKSSESINLPVSNKDIFDIRQNFVEVLFAIPLTDYELIFGVSKENLKEMYGVSDCYGENNDIWRLDD